MQNSKRDGKRLLKKEQLKKESLGRWLSLLLSLCMVVSLFGGVVSFPALAQGIEQSEPEEETREEIKTRLPRQIKEEGWDPYSADMSLDEFYALMELFQEGTLPLDEEDSAVEVSVTDLNFNELKTEELKIEEPDIGWDADDLYIPRTMFLFSGLNTENSPNKDRTAQTGYRYSASLDSYDYDYTRPPEDWYGVEINDNMQVRVIVPDINEGDHTISGDVDQKLFPRYSGYYVRRVTAQNSDVTILGVIRLREQNRYVYYYTNNEEQSTEVSVTTLPEGQKFITQYNVIEHSVEFQVKMNDVDGEDVTAQWIDDIFGTDRPAGTSLGAYAFTAQAPNGYTLSFYLSKKSSEGGWDKPKLQLGTKEEREEESVGLYTGVNNGWALGEEPVYNDKSTNGYSMLASPNLGPGTLTTSGTFYNNQVDEDRLIIAVLRKKPDPVLSIRPIQERLRGVEGRGSTVKGEYDWDVDYVGNLYPDREGGRPNLPDQMLDGGWNWNDSSYAEAGGKKMTRNPDGTYSYSWIFQTNSGENYVLDVLEVNGVGIPLPFNPRYLWNGNPNGYNGSEKPGDQTGIGAWYTETGLPDGAVVRVEYLLVFGSSNHQRHYRIIVTNARSNVTITGMNLNMYNGGSPEFSIYQLDGVTGANVKDGDARVEAIQYYDKGETDQGKKLGWSNDEQQGNVVIDSIDYKGGDSDCGGANIRFKLAEGYDSPYYLYESIRGGVIYDGTSRQASTWRDASGKANRELQNAVVPYVSDGTKPWMMYDDTGEPVPVTAEGKSLYDEDGNLFTDWSRIRVERNDGGEEILVPELHDVDGTLLDVGDVIAGENTKVFKFGNDADANLKSQYIYEGVDGWYYIRLATQANPETGSDYKIALLTIVAHPKRYVVRYMPNILEGIEDAEGKVIVDARLPENMPMINHFETCPVFFQLDDPDRPEEQFDDNSGAFYDVAVNNIAVLSRAQPTDPENYYKFVDWVLVGEDYQPVRRHVTGPDGNWLQVDGEYVTEEIHFASGSINIKDISEFGILNDDIGSIDMDIYVLRLMPTWDKIEQLFHYTVALNWVDASGGLHDEYFHGLWSDVLTYYELDDDGLNVMVLTDAGPFQEWIAQNPTYTFWDAVNNATDGMDYDKTDSAHEDRESDEYKNLTDDEKSEEEKIQDALDSYFSEMKVENIQQKKYDDVLQALLNKNKEGSPEVNDFSRNGDYTFTVWEDRGVIAIWMYESDPHRLSVGTDNMGVELSNLEPSLSPSDDPTVIPSDALSLPQTGQFWWPVLLLVAVGVPSLMIGTVLLIRKEEQEEFEEPNE